MRPVAAINYLIPPLGYPWHWSDDASAIEWEDGTTVCLWMELHALLNHAAPQGLPPLGSLLLLLMACAGRHTTAITSIQAFAARTTGGEDASASSKPLIKQMANVLAAIAALPEELRTGLSARAHLLMTLSAGSHHLLSPENSRAMLVEADTWGVEQLRLHRPQLTGVARLLRDLKAIASIHASHDLTTLTPLLRTGVGFVEVHPARVPEPERTPGDATLPLLRQLENRSDHKLAAIAAVARRMVAMFALPRPAGFPQELPVGGISDITNRGPLDRLLPSELAADDAFLMARLANHEALYFRRDTPPDEPASRRIILMDSGIQLWGLPRLYALAAALGLKAAAGEEPVAVWLREGGTFQPLALETVAGIQDCLQRLHADPDAAPALSGFTVDDNQPQRPDVFFITIPGSREPVRQALHELACRVQLTGGRCYVITISRSGAVELSARTRAGTRVTATGRINPDIILKAPPSPEAKPASRSRLTDLPAIIRHLDFYQQYPLPFRFPATPLRTINDFHFGQWHINVDTRRRLMMWDNDPLHGAGEIAAGMPKSRDYHVNRHGEEWLVLCSGREPGHKATAVCIGMKDPVRREVRLDSSHPFPLWMKAQNGAAILGYSDKAEACSLTDGSRLHLLVLPKDTRRESVVFDGQHLGLATASPDGLALPPAPREIPIYPSILGAPVSAGFVASGTLVIRAQGGRWELTMPEFIFTPSQKSQLSAVRPFRPVSPDSESEADETPAFYEAVWHEDCRMIFDTRGLLHLVFADRSGRAEVTLLCLLGKPVAAWVAHLPQPLFGNADWMLKPPAGAPGVAVSLVPWLQRFAALARAANSSPEWREAGE